MPAASGPYVRIHEDLPCSPNRLNEDDPHYSGTFQAKGNRLIFDWPGEGYALTFTFERERNGSLVIKPVLPMDRGDQFVWASEPWRRVGPPVRGVP